MSLVDLAVLPPSRGKQQEQQQTQKKGEEAQTQQQKPEQLQPPPAPSSYTNQPSPKVHQSRDSMDSAVFQEFYAPRSPTEEAPTSDATDSLLVSKKRNPMEDPPALPQRNALRASRILVVDHRTIKQNKLDEPHKQPLSSLSETTTTPHDLYLSSEEEPSSSADDFSDHDSDDDVEDYEPRGQEESQQKSPVKRKSHEDTARAVSVVFSGRPSIIDVSTSKRSASPVPSLAAVVVAAVAAAAAEAETRQRQPQRPRTSFSSTAGSPVDNPRPSTSSGPSPPSLKSLRSFRSPSHPLRSSSTGLPPSVGLSKHRPQFINTDPFPSRGGLDTKKLQAGEGIPRTPKTPTGVFKQVTRTLSLVRKRSRPVLNKSSNSNNGASKSITSHAPPAGPTNRSTSDLLFPLERSQTPQSMHSMPEDPSTRSTSGEFVLHSEPQSRRDSGFLVPPPPPPAPRTPRGPAGTMKKGFLALARRRSLHVRAAKV